MKTIKDVICDFKNKFGLSGLWSKPTSYMEYEDVTNKVEDYLQSSLTSLLDSLEKELPKKKGKTGFVEMIFNNGRKNKISVETNYDLGWNECLEEVINIINSHR